MSNCWNALVDVVQATWNYFILPAFFGGLAGFTGRLFATKKNSISGFRVVKLSTGKTYRLGFWKFVIPGALAAIGANALLVNAGDFKQTIAVSILAGFNGFTWLANNAMANTTYEKLNAKVDELLKEDPRED